MALLRWLSVALATLATTTALHAQTASFSVLGLTSLFGQEVPPQPTLNILPWNVLTANNVLGWTLELPDFEAIEEPTDVQELPAAPRGGNSLSTFITHCMHCWKEQWSLGNFRQAEMLATMACKLDPNNVTCRHALALSQIMKQLSEKVPPYPLSDIIAQVVCQQSNQCPAVATGSTLSNQSTPARGSASGGSSRNSQVNLTNFQFTPLGQVNGQLQGSDIVSGLTPAGTLTPDLNIPVSNGCLSGSTTKLVSAEKTCEKCAKANSCCATTASAEKTCACAAKPDCCCAKATQTVQATPACCCVKAIQAKPDCCCAKVAQAKPNCCCAKSAEAKTMTSSCQAGSCCERSTQKTQEEVTELIKQYRLLVRQGKYKEALAAVCKAKELDPDNLAADAAIQIMLIRTSKEYQDGNHIVEEIMHKGLNPDDGCCEVGELYRCGCLTAAGFRAAIKKYGIKTVINLQDECGCCSACSPKSAPSKKAQSVVLPSSPFTVVGESSDANAPCPFLEGLRAAMTAPMLGSRIFSSVAYPPVVLPNPVTMLPGFPGLPMPAPDFGGPGLPTPEQVMRDLEMVRNAAMQKARFQISAMQGQAVAKHNVHLVVANMEAHCERLASSPNSDHMVLEGDVHLTCKRNGRTIQIQGQRVVVNLADGSFAVESTSTPPPATMLRIPVPMAPQPASYTMPPSRGFIPPAPFTPPVPDDSADPVDD